MRTGEYMLEAALKTAVGNARAIRLFVSTARTPEVSVAMDGYLQRIAEDLKSLERSAEEELAAIRRMSDAEKDTPIVAVELPAD